MTNHPEITRIIVLACMWVLLTAARDAHREGYQRIAAVAGMGAALLALGAFIAIPL